MFYEFQHFGVSEYFFKYHGESSNFPTHLHQSFELIIVTSGKTHVTIDNKEYFLEKGESVLIFPNQIHTLSGLFGTRMVCIFSGDLVRAFTSKLLNTRPKENLMYLDDKLINALDNLLDSSSILEKKGILYCICAEFDKSAEYIKKPSFEENLIQNIFEFVEKNYTGDCELNSLAEKTGYNYSYLSRCFKKTTGISFNTYVNMCRINRACYLLNNSNYSILQCALDSGYKSIRSFNRNFMGVFNITPREYRKRVKKR